MISNGLKVAIEGGIEGKNIDNYFLNLKEIMGSGQTKIEPNDYSDEYLKV